MWSIIFILIGRALNIFPLSVLCNKFRKHQITKKMMLIMWFSGLRGAIAYALCLHLEFNDDVRRVLVTTTLVIVLFTTIGLGGGTMPLMKYLVRNQLVASFPILEINQVDPPCFVGEQGASQEQARPPQEGHHLVQNKGVGRNHRL